MGKMYRTQILLEPEQHQALTKLAQNEERSVSEIIREIVHEYLLERKRELQHQREMQALDRLAKIRRRIQKQHGLYPDDLLTEARMEREQDIDRIWSDEK
jgi:predicted DNA-binding protein